MLKLIRFFRLLICLYCSSASLLFADVQLPSIFGDHMVLQQGSTIPIWGLASPGERVFVRYSGRFGMTTADVLGKWRVTLRPLKTSSQPDTLFVSGRNLIEIRDVIVGDVWICAGGGNMEFPLSRTGISLERADHVEDAELRFFVMENKPSAFPEYIGAGHWSVCSSMSAGGFSAVGYFFARDIRSAWKIPIGMVCCAWDGTPTAAWISEKGLSVQPSYSDLLAQYRKGQTQLRAGSQIGSNTGYEQGDFSDSKKIPSVLFNGMIAPLIPYAISGVIWYQGESEQDNGALQYRRLFPRLIVDWRNNWGQGPFPFYFVSLAGFGEDNGSSVEHFRDSEGHAGRGWPWIREGQAGALKLPFTGMTVASDLGTPDETTPPDKLDVGRRLALIARHQFYGEVLLDSGPIFNSMRIVGDKAILDFDKTGKGLTVGVPPSLSENKMPSISPVMKGFSIAGADRRWFPAIAFIDQNKIVLRSDAVPHPDAVRYNWRGLTDGNLYNMEGLPAAPFRTDSDQP